MSTRKEKARRRLSGISAASHRDNLAFERHVALTIEQLRAARGKQCQTDRRVFAAWVIALLIVLPLFGLLVALACVDGPQW